MGDGRLRLDTIYFNGDLGYVFKLDDTVNYAIQQDKRGDWVIKSYRLDGRGNRQYNSRGTTMEERFASYDEAYSFLRLQHGAVLLEFLDESRQAVLTRELSFYCRRHMERNGREYTELYRKTESGWELVAPEVIDIPRRGMKGTVYYRNQKTPTYLYECIDGLLRTYKSDIQLFLLTGEDDDATPPLCWRTKGVLHCDFSWSLIDKPIAGYCVREGHCIDITLYPLSI